MHMSKVRTTINLNENVVKKAKSMGINISAAAERGIINYIKELENIGSENKNSNNLTTNHSRQSSVRTPSGKQQWTGWDLNPRPPPCEGGDLPLIYQPLDEKCKQN